MRHDALPSALAFVLLLAAVGIASPARAAPSYDGCTGFVDSLPAVISSAGTWCLRKDLATALATGNAIDILANNVTLDCNGFRIGGLASGTATQAAGIASTDRANVTIRNCLVRGFSFGIRFSGNNLSNILVEDNVVDGATFVGMQVYGEPAVVRRNRVIDTGGSTRGNLATYGIVASRAVVEDNVVSGLTLLPVEGAIGAVGIVDFGRSRIRDNSVSGLAPSAGQRIAIDLSSQSEARGNHLLGPGDIAVNCPNANPQAIGNHANGFATGLNLCGNGGGNVVVP